LRARFELSAIGETALKLATSGSILPALDAFVIRRALPRD